jgi:hypothetical protein
MTDERSGADGLAGAASRVFELWRQDDNGNRFLVSVHDDSLLAEAALREFESGVQHKQLYFVVTREPEM